jgi:hypothetical protein
MFLFAANLEAYHIHLLLGDANPMHGSALTFVTFGTFTMIHFAA